MTSSFYEDEKTTGTASDISGRKAIGYLMPFLGPHRRRLFGCLALLVSATLLSLMWPILLRRAIDVPLANGDLSGLIAIAAAIARAKAQKLASANATESSAEKTVASDTTKMPEIEAAEVKAKQDKQALIAAAIERAKAQKLAAVQAGLAPKNTENVSTTVQAEINETDAIREKAKLITETKEPD